MSTPTRETWCEYLSPNQVHTWADVVTVMMGGHTTAVVEKEYGPTAASPCRVRLEHQTGEPEWVVEYLNPSTRVWEEKARWPCQENWPVDATK